MNFTESLFDREFCPLNMVKLHHIFRFLHTDSFIKRYGVLISDQVYGDILAAARCLKSLFHQLFSDPSTGIAPIDAQISYIQPVSVVGQPKQNADDLTSLIFRRKADRSVFQQFRDSFTESLFWILRAQIRPRQKLDIIFR